MNKSHIEDSLAEFSSELREGINAEIDFEIFDGVIPAALVDKLAGLSDRTAGISDLMLQLLPLASHFALPVISDFYVGAIAQGESGALYLGANLETKKIGLGNSIHAEQSAVNNALQHGEKGLKRIAVTAAPCGHCRQFLNEIKDADQLEIIVVNRQAACLKDLLPESFSPFDLGAKYALFEKDDSSSAKNEALSERIHQLPNMVNVDSYAPHTGSLSKVSLKVSEQVFAVGAYIENAAYNPSLSPFLSALDRLRFREKDFSLITEVMLAEIEDAPVSQIDHVRSLLHAIAPRASFNYATI